MPKLKPYLLGAAVFFTLLAVSININKGSVKLVWRDKPMTALLIVIFGLLFFLLYIQIDRYQTNKLHEKIRVHSFIDKSNRLETLEELTNRQKQVYDLIIAGYSNKEIMSELFIEQSTLKTHINQLYKKLNVKNRKGLKNLDGKFQ